LTLPRKGNVNKPNEPPQCLESFDGVDFLVATIGTWAGGKTLPRPPAPAPVAAPADGSDGAKLVVWLSVSASVTLVIVVVGIVAVRRLRRRRVAGLPKVDHSDAAMPTSPFAPAGSSHDTSSKVTLSMWMSQGTSSSLPASLGALDHELPNWIDTLRSSGVPVLPAGLLVYGTDDSDKIGEGAFGKVYFATLSGVRVALKRVALPTANPAKLQSALAEVFVLMHVAHPHLVRLLAVSADEDNRIMHLALELCVPVCPSLAIFYWWELSYNY
jgi:hypothetical protein